MRRMAINKLSAQTAIRLSVGVAYRSSVISPPLRTFVASSSSRVLRTGGCRRRRGSVAIFASSSYA